MVIKWTAENDQHLLLKIVQTMNSTPNYAAIAEGWCLGDEKPSVKSIVERISKLKRIAAGKTAANPDVPKTPRKKTFGTASNYLSGSYTSPQTPAREYKSPTKSPAGTPRTPKTPKATPKRKRAVTSEPDAEIEYAMGEDDNGVVVKSEFEESPTKKTKVNTPAPAEEDGFGMGFDGAFDNGVVGYGQDLTTEMW